MSLGFVVESSGQDFQDGRNNLRAVMLGGWLGADILTDSIEVNSSHRFYGSRARLYGFRRFGG
jgi:hypothetical protein